jgi:mono/diheme cytochrome c family protein
MTPRSFVWVMVTLLMLILLAGCAPPRLLPQGPTPIPTLIPVPDQPLGQTDTTPSIGIQSFPVQAPNASNGMVIYQERCAECHGLDGTGTVPAARDFRDEDYMRGETPASFYTAITEGQGDMPSYAELLSSDQRWDVVFYVWQMSTSSSLIETGRTLYDRDCASCHGTDGDEELLGATNFTDLRQTSLRAPRDLYTILTQGRGSMPAYQSLLSQEDRWAILDYVRTFTYNPSFEDPPSTDPTEETQVDFGACSTDQLNPFAWDDTEAIETGQTLYEANCRGCHGVDGSGGLPNAPDFTSTEVNSDLIGQPGDYYCALTEGEGAMPAYGESHSDDERWMLITFLASIGQ